MTLPAFATIEDVEARLQRALDGDETVQAQAALDEASDLARAETGRDWVDDDGELDGTDAQLAAVRGVVATAASRVLRNPAGEAQQTAGPFSRSFGAGASPSVYFTKSERLRLHRAGGRTGLTTISTTRGPVETPTLRGNYLPVDDERG